MNILLDLLNDKKSKIYKKSYDDNTKQSRVQVELKIFLKTEECKKFMYFLPKIYKLDWSKWNIIKLNFPKKYLSDFKYCRLLRELIDIYSILNNKPKIYLSQVKLKKKKIVKYKDLYTNRQPYDLECLYYTDLIINDVNKGCLLCYINKINKNKINITDDTKYNVVVNNLDGTLSKPINCNIHCKKKKIINLNLNIVYENNITDIELNLFNKPKLYKEITKNIKCYVGFI